MCVLLSVTYGFYIWSLTSKLRSKWILTQINQTHNWISHWQTIGTNIKVTIHIFFDFVVLDNLVIPFPHPLAGYMTITQMWKNNTILEWKNATFTHQNYVKITFITFLVLKSQSWGEKSSLFRNYFWAAPACFVGMSNRKYRWVCKDKLNM